MAAYKCEIHQSITEDGKTKVEINSESLGDLMLGIYYIAKTAANNMDLSMDEFMRFLKVAVALKELGPRADNSMEQEEDKENGRDD